MKSDGTATVSETYQLKLNGPPVITSAILATPALPYIEQQTQYSVGASDPDSDPLTYLWSFGDGLTSSLASPSHSYGAPGEYTVSVTVNDNVSGQASSSQKITVKADALPVTKLAVKLNFAKTQFPGFEESQVNLDMVLVKLQRGFEIAGGLSRERQSATAQSGRGLPVRQSTRVA